MAMRADVIVLGAGMVGASVALHLQQRGRDVVLVDRRRAGEETSYGNAGLIQREGVIPYTFPREFGTILSYAMNHPAMPSITCLHWHVRIPTKSPADSEMMSPGDTR
jgi:glycine/D-amino acid oxidase-like deaminating enzyme